jgi:hypothetical protein
LSNLVSLFFSLIYVCGKTGSILNAKKKEEEAKKKMFQTIDSWTRQGDDIFKLKMVKYLTCEPRLVYMMEVLRL